MTTALTDHTTEALSDFDKRQRDRFIEDVKTLLQIYEDTPNLAAPFGPDSLCIFADTPQQLLDWRRAFRFTDKEATDGHIGFKGELGKSFIIRLFCSRSKACTRVEVGEKVIPATPAVTLPATPERIEKVYEWKCSPILEARE